MSNTEALRQRLSDEADLCRNDGADDIAALLDEAAAALTQPAVSGAPAEPLKGWQLNHVQYVRGEGTAQIGYFDPDDDRFSPILTVDTGLYYQADQAAPLAVAILGAIADATRQPAPVPSTARWYCVSREGMATLCTDKENALEVAAESFVAYPHNGPYRAVMLVEVAQP